MNIQIEASSTACWQKLIQEAMVKTHYTINQDIESYLIFLLKRFMQDGSLADTILALDYLESQYKHGLEQQELLRNVGDKCLLLGGFYPEQAHKKLVSLEYFVTLGRESYNQIAKTTKLSTNLEGLNQLFADLSRNFLPLLNILNEIRLLDQTKEWMLDEITKYEKQRLEFKLGNKIINNDIITIKPRLH